MSRQLFGWATQPVLRTLLCSKDIKKKEWQQQAQSQLDISHYAGGLTVAVRQMDLSRHTSAASARIPWKINMTISHSSPQCLSCGHCAAPAQALLWSMHQGPDWPPCRRRRLL